MSEPKHLNVSGSVKLDDQVADGIAQIELSPQTKTIRGLQVDILWVLVGQLVPKSGGLKWFEVL